MARKPTVKRTPEELRHLYEGKLKMLAKRCDDYYNGDHFEARDIASILRALLYDYGKRTQSVLGQMGIIDKYRYLDSRVHNNLSLASLKGAWPRTPMPYDHYTDKSLHAFNDWWEGQEFQILYKDIIFTRKELVLTIAQEEGVSHVSPKVDERIAKLNRIESPWQTYGVSNKDSYSGIHEFELASICAIAEELLFSLMPEPENRKRMHSEHFQKPFYLSMAESDKYKSTIRRSMLKLDHLLGGEATHRDKILLEVARQSLDTALEIKCLTAKDCEVLVGVAQLMKQAKVPWDEA